MQIHKYTRVGDIEGVKRCLEEGVSIEAVEPRTNLTPLMLAVQSPDAGPEIVQFLLEQGADVAVVGGDFPRNVLAQAVKAGNPRKVELLLDAGADIHYVEEANYNVIIDAMNFGNDNLVPLLELLISRGADINMESDYGESALSLAAYRARFDVIQFLLGAGADPEPLEWSELHRAVALGTVQEVEELVRKGADLTARDSWNRTPWLLSLQTGDIEKAKLLLAWGADINDRGNCGLPPLSHAVEAQQLPMVQWLLELGVDVNATNDFGWTPLKAAVGRNFIECTKVLLAAGAKTSRLETHQMRVSKSMVEDTEQLLVEYGLDFSYSQEMIEEMEQPYTRMERVIEDANSLEMVQLLVDAGDDINNISDEMRAKLTGLESEGVPEATQAEYDQAKHREFGRTNPELMNRPFWQAMVRCAATAYRAKATFGDDGNYNMPAVWCFHRFGKSITLLPDGRIIEIAGEHEDSYDTDFCIYNDVFVHHGEGKFDIYGYPEKVFPPTDFHTATLVGEYIYIIGCLGYPQQRKPKETPMYRLHTESLVIEKVKTTGQNPGWIYDHKARLQDSGEIWISEGKILKSKRGGEKWEDNGATYILDVKTMTWRKQED